VVTHVTDQEIRSLHAKEWLLMAASALSVAFFFVVGLTHGA
jgi:hypothetical protein